MLFCCRGMNPDFFRIDVVANPPKNRRPQCIIVGPAVELDFGDELRLHPRRGRIELGPLDKRTRASPQGLEPRLDILERGVVEARADMRGVMKPGLLPISHENGAQRLARSLALGITADDEVRGLRRL